MLNLNLSMKTLLSTIALMATLAGTAAAAPYVLPPMQAGALTTNDWQPVYALDFVAALADKDDFTDLYGPRASFSLYSADSGDFLHEFSLNAAYLMGDDKYYPYTMDISVIPVTLGYDLHINIVGDLYLDLGVTAGYSMGTSSYESSMPYDWPAPADVDLDGFTFSVGAGFMYKPSEDIYIKLGYEYSRSYFDRTEVGIWGQHVISVGIGCQF